jgi:putative holliday junction resolvase
MKYIGIDYGTKRIGVAVSDDAGEFAFPKTIIKAESGAFEAVLAIAIEEHAAGIVIGYSIATNGAENEVVSLAQRFKEKLEAGITIPIFLEREDFSSFEAHRYQTKAGNRDDSAAAIILQRFLDKQRKTV